MAVKNMEKWLGFQFSSGSYVGDDYKRFQRDAKTCLKKMCTENGLLLHSFSGNHYEFSAVLQNELTHKYVYLSISAVSYTHLDVYKRQILV